MGAVSIIDDILVFGKSHKEHDGKLAAALEKLQSAGMTLKRDVSVLQEQKNISGPNH